MRLIDADELKRALKSNCTPELCHDYRTAWCVACCPHNDFVYLLDNSPTVNDIISAKDFKKRINNMEYIYIQACAKDVIDAIDCEVTYFKEKQNNGTR